MELVYLWVDEYKNIDKQGFDFSPKFNCNYDPDTNELTIVENDNYIDNFFGENINVMAIVGKNGSGKSSILEIFANLILQTNIENSIILSIYKNKKLIFITNIKSLNINYSDEYEIKSIHDINDYNIFSVYYSPNFTNGNLNQFLELFTTPFFRTHIKDDMKSYDKHGYNNDNFKNQSLLNFIFNANRIIDHHPTKSGYMQQHAFTIEEQYRGYEIGKIIYILSFLKLFGTGYLPVNIKNDDIVTINIQHNSYTAKNLESNILVKIEKLLELEVEFYEDDEKKIEYNRNVKKDEYQVSYKKLMAFLKKNINDDNDTFSLSIVDALEFIKEYLNIYRFNRNLQNSIFDFSFKNLSSGEENLILMFALIERGISSYLDHEVENNNYNVLLMLDEIENNLHPNWQKVLFKELLSFLMLIEEHYQKEYKKKIQFTILLSSHSPFLLSDIPKQNIIFLDTDAENNCKVLKHDEVMNKKQTFGANIHTLLSDSFFMEEGLMGKFAKGKIKEIIDFHKQVEQENKKKDSSFFSLNTEYEDKKKRFWNVQTIIGEEYLKQVIKNHLVDIEHILLGYDEAIDEEIKRLRAEADRLESLS